MQRVAWTIPVGAVLLVVGILGINGFPHGRDWPYELTRVAEMREAFAGGQLPPYWAPDDYHGFGSPVFLYYAPLYATIASLFTTIAEVPDAAIIAIILAVIAGALMMRAAVADIAGQRAAGFAVIAFVLHPYLLADIWIRNANAEVMALALLPGVIAGAISRNPSRRFWWTFLSLSGVIIAHNLTSLIATAMVACIAVFVQRTVRALAPTLAGILCALAVTSFFWLPAMAMQSLAVRNEALIGGRFDFHGLFPRPVALVVLNPPDEYSSGGYLGALMVVALVVASLRWRGGDEYARRVVRACAIAAVVLILLMLRISTPVWEHLPLIRYLQFPWRLVGPLGVVTIIGASMLLSSGVAAGPSPAGSGDAGEAPAATPIVALALFVIAAIVNALPIILIYPRMERAEMRRFTALLTPEGIQSHGLRTIVGDVYLPRDADPRVTRAGRGSLGAVSDGVSARAQTSRGDVLVAVSGTGGAIAFRRWSFPVWEATIDGRSVPITTMSPGIVALFVPPGQHDVRLTLVEPLIRTIAKAVSAIALAIIGAVARLRRRRAVHFVNTVTSADEPAGT